MLSNSIRKAPDLKENVALFLVDNLHFESFQQLDQFNRLNRDQIDRAASMSPKRAKEYRLSRWLLRYALEQFLPLRNNTSINIEDRENLPPFCHQAQDADIHFSISHSADLVGVAVSKLHPVGLDIEFRGKLRGYLDTAEQFCSEEELNALKALDSETRQAALFYLLWTQKEAYLKSKCLGIGSMELGAIRFQNAASDPEPGINPFYSAMCFLHREYQLAVVAQQTRQIDLVELTWQDGRIQHIPDHPHFDLYRYFPETD